MTYSRKGVSTSVQLSLCVVAEAIAEATSDDVLVRSWVGDDGLFEKPVEEHSSLSRCSSVEAECELVEVGIEML